MASKVKEPVGRFEAFSFVHNDQFYVCQGLHKCDGSEGGDWKTHPMQRYDFSSAQWSDVFPVCADHEPEEQNYWKSVTYGCEILAVATGACCAVLGDCAYTLGGDWKYGYAVHELNLETMVWRRLEPNNAEEGPMHKKNAGMVPCDDEALCVFGGYGRGTGRHQPGATYHMVPKTDDYFTNELHLFHIKTGTWSSPETTGPRPTPCSGFSFTKVDLSRVVLYGGHEIRDHILHELHILDMENWHWSGEILPSGPADLWPQSRCLHSACVLFDPTPSSASEGSSKETPHSSPSDTSIGQHNPKLFVLWGNGRNWATKWEGPHKNVADAWILDVNSITWKQVKLPSAVGKRRQNFSFGCHCRSPTEAELVVFGGLQEKKRGPRLVLVNVADTTLFYKGMKTLYHSCVDYVAERYELYQPLLQQLLPRHIQTNICREKNKRDNYIVAQL